MLDSNKDDPLYTFFNEYNNFTEEHPDQFFIFDEKYVISEFDKDWVMNNSEIKEMIASRFMHLLKMFYLEPSKISNNIERLP